MIGEGGMGVVYRALDTKLNRPVAVKFLYLLRRYISDGPDDDGTAFEGAQPSELLPTTGTAAPPPLTVIENWQQKFRR